MSRSTIKRIGISYQYTRVELYDLMHLTWLEAAKRNKYGRRLKYMLFLMGKKQHLQNYLNSKVLPINFVSEEAVQGDWKKDVLGSFWC